jgi:hypothetical protein
MVHVRILAAKRQGHPPAIAASMRQGSPPTTVDRQAEVDAANGPNSSAHPDA